MSWSCHKQREINISLISVLSSATVVALERSSASTLEKSYCWLMETEARLRTINQIVMLFHNILPMYAFVATCSETFIVHPETKKQFTYMCSTGILLFLIDMAVESYLWLQIFLHLRKLFDSMREVVFTVSPNKQYRGIFIPTTPTATGPECNPWIVYISTIRIYIFICCFFTLKHLAIHHQHSCKKKLVKTIWFCMFEIALFIFLMTWAV